MCLLVFISLPLKSPHLLTIKQSQRWLIFRKKTVCDRSKIQYYKVKSILRRSYQKSFEIFRGRYGGLRQPSKLVRTFLFTFGGRTTSPLSTIKSSRRNHCSSAYSFTSASRHNRIQNNSITIYKTVRAIISLFHRRRRASSHVTISTNQEKPTHEKEEKRTKSVRAVGSSGKLQKEAVFRGRKFFGFCIKLVILLGHSSDYTQVKR